MIKLVNILESITENQVTKGDWGKADGEQRVDWLLQIFDDVDEAEKHFETEWEDLPNEARDFMKISESVNEGLFDMFKRKTTPVTVDDSNASDHELNRIISGDVGDVSLLAEPEDQITDWVRFFLYDFKKSNFTQKDDPSSAGDAYSDVRAKYGENGETITVREIGDIVAKYFTKWKVEESVNEDNTVDLWTAPAKSFRHGMEYYKLKSKDIIKKLPSKKTKKGLKYTPVLVNLNGKEETLYLRESVNEGFTKHDWDVKWKTPKDNLFNVTKTVDSVNNRYKAIQDLLKLNPKELQAFDATDDHPAYDMSYDELMRWYYQIMKESVNEEQLKKGDVLIMKATGQKWKIVRPHGDGYYVRISGENSMGWHPSDWFDMMLRTKKAAIEGGIKESVNEGSPGYSKFIFSLQTLIGDIAPNAWEDKSQIDSTSMKRIHNSLKKRYGDDYAKFNDLLKTQKGQFGWWYLKEPVNEELSKLLEKIKGIDGKACWKGYKYAGTKDGKDKCVPMNEEEVDMSINEVMDMEIIDENITEAKFKGKTVTLNKPTRGDSKKFKVYVNSGKKNADGSIKVKKVNFGHGGTSAKKAGQKTMSIRKSNPKARSAFRARHNCDSPGPKTMARYWSCKKW